jgi:hypothetical protein
MGFSEMFYTGLYTASMAFCLGVFSYLYKSKCKQVDICCIKIVRDVELEEKELEIITKSNTESSPRKF